MARDVVVYPAEGFGAHIRSAKRLAYKVNNPLTFRAAWKVIPESVVPEYQVCVGNDVANVITFSDITVPDPRISLSLGTGVITFNEYFKDIDLTISFQVYRQLTGGITTWGFAIETLVEGVGWVAIPDSTKYLTIQSQDANIIKTVTYSVSSRFIEDGSQFRFVQACSDASKNIGLISERPLTSLPEGAGASVSITSR